MMSVQHTTPPHVPPHVLAIVEAARVADVEFCDWWVAAPPHEGTVCGHIQVADRRAVSRVLEALLGVDARLDVDVGPSTADAHGRWSVWVRANHTQSHRRGRE